jgi:hypothetical protein
MGEHEPLLLLEPLGVLRRRVLDALAHRQPERVPFTWGFPATAEMQAVLAGYFAAQGVDWATLCGLVCDRVARRPMPAPGRRANQAYVLSADTT